MFHFLTSRRTRAAVQPEPAQPRGGQRRPTRSALLPLAFNRRHEPERRYFRCGRFVTVGHEWYVAVREGSDIGPYSDRDEALLALVRHVAACCVASARGVAAMDDCGGRPATELEELVREILECWELHHLRSENCAYVWLKQRLDVLSRDADRTSVSAPRIKLLEHLLDEFDRTGAIVPSETLPRRPNDRVR